MKLEDKIYSIKRSEGKQKYYFKLAGGLSYRGFGLPMVKLQQMYEGNPGEIDFGSSLHEVQVAGEG